MRVECVVFWDPPPVQALSMHTDAFVYCDKKAALTVCNVLPVNQLPEGTIINIEEKVGDRGALARMSGNYATVIGPVMADEIGMGRSYEGWGDDRSGAQCDEWVMRGNIWEKNG